MEWGRLSALCVIAASIAAAEVENQPEVDAPAPIDKARSDDMNRLVRGYVLYEVKEDNTKSRLDFREGSLLRWSNPVSGVKPGDVFLWTRDGRPAAILKMFFHPRVGWFQNFHSMSPTRISAVQQDGTTIWRPRKSGIEMAGIPEAPPPATSPRLRLLQMRDVLRQVSVRDEFREKSEWVLRLFSEPLYRYGNPQSDVLDGAIFAFVQGTNPEVIVLLEARRVDQTEEEYQWCSAFCALTSYRVRALYQDKPVWSVGVRYDRQTTPEDTFFVRRLREAGVK
ncbi:MAG: hypothetical protein HQ582_08170 [Planctomycetes bacterium]|nr:hypothetical protein [Planctomycetota bacterium]